MNTNRPKLPSKRIFLNGIQRNKIQVFDIKIYV